MSHKVLFTFVRSLVLACTLPLAVGCGEPLPGEDAVQKAPHLIPTANLDEAVQLLTQTQVTCHTPGECAEAVGMLGVADAAGAHTCTGFLIGPDLVVTNGHCIPDDLKAPNSLCSKRIRFSLPSTGAKDAETLDCSEVILATASSNPTYIATPDYAVLRMKSRSRRKPLESSSEGVVDSQTLGNERVVLTSRVRPIGVIRHQQCRSLMRSAALPSYSHSKAPVLLFTDCEIEGGNSGSPLLDAQGKVVAIVQAFMSPNHRQEMQNSIHGDTLASMNYATWMGCVRTSDVWAPLPETCASLPLAQPTADRIRAAYQLTDVSGLGSELEQKVAQWSAGEARMAPKAVKWTARLVTEREMERIGGFSTVSRAGSEFIYVAAPGCFRPRDEWRRERRYRGNFLGIGMLNDYAEDGKLPTWVSRFTLDRYLRGKPAYISDGPVLSAHIAFSPKDLKQDDESLLQLFVGGVSSNVPIINGKVGFCN